MRERALETVLQNLLVIFEATNERIESLALALGLGAVQHGANIRLRHLSAPEESVLAHQGYGRLKPGDLEWAECVAVGLESAEINEDLSELLALLRASKQAGVKARAKAYLFGDIDEGKSVAYRALRGELELVGFALVSDESIDGDGRDRVSVEFMTRAGNALADLQI